MRRMDAEGARSGAKGCFLKKPNGGRAFGGVSLCGIKRHY